MRVAMYAFFLSLTRYMPQLLTRVCSLIPAFHPQARKASRASKSATKLDQFLLTDGRGSPAGSSAGAHPAGAHAAAPAGAGSGAEDGAGAGDGVGAWPLSAKGRRGPASARELAEYAGGLADPGKARLRTGSADRGKERGALLRCARGCLNAASPRPLPAMLCFVLLSFAAPFQLSLSPSRIC